MENFNDCLKKDVAFIGVKQFQMILSYMQDRNSWSEQLVYAGLSHSFSRHPSNRGTLLKLCLMLQNPFHWLSHGKQGTCHHPAVMFQLARSCYVKLSNDHTTHSSLCVLPTHALQISHATETSASDVIMSC